MVASNDHHDLSYKADFNFVFVIALEFLYSNEQI